MIDLDPAFGQQADSESSDRSPTTRSPTTPGPGDVRRAAMNLLARREHARKELVQKLSKKFSAIPEIVEEELDKLRAEGLQSDARLAEVFIRSRVNRGQGPVKIKMELRGKGVDNDTLARAFETCEVNWFALVEQVARRRFGDSVPSDAKERARRGRFLQQRGFNFDQIGSLN
jgi:regulatory protein